jgi:hypothetical protein
MNTPSPNGLACCHNAAGSPGYGAAGGVGADAGTDGV